MALIVIIGGQAVGKMTVGKALEQKINGKLLYNHQTIDLYANFLGYNQHTFKLSDQTRKALFQAFVENKNNNLVESIIFTVLINFDLADDIQFLKDISSIFLTGQEEVYFVELVADIETRLLRNSLPDRLAAKPSKRDLDFSKKDLLETAKNHRVESLPSELTTNFPEVPSLIINNNNISAEKVADKIVSAFELN